MATLKNVQDSMQSENKTQNEVLDIPSGYNATPTPADPPKIGYVIFRLVNKKQRRLWLDGICDNCYNPKTKEYEKGRVKFHHKSIIRPKNKKTHLFKMGSCNMLITTYCIKLLLRSLSL